VSASDRPLRVLVVARASPYPSTTGSAQRTNAIVQAVSVHHLVTLSCPLDVDLRPAAEAALGQRVDRFVWIDPDAARPKGLPVTGSRIARFGEYLKDFFCHLTPLAFRQASPQWANLLRPILEDVDAVVCTYASVTPLVGRFDRRKVVVDFGDLLFVAYWQEVWSGQQGYGAILYVFEAIRCFLAEQVMGLRCARVLVVSAKDRGRLLTRRSASLVPNGVTIEIAHSHVEHAQQRLVFVGDCRWDPNALGLKWFVQTVWPRIRAECPHATFAIVGRSANKNTLPFADDSAIELADNVPSVRPWFESATVSVVPLFMGAGTRIKILESLGYSIPVVSTPVGAAGLTDEIGPDLGLLIVDGADAMAAKLLEVLRAPDKARGAALKGRDYVRANFSWEVTMRPLATELSDWVGRTTTTTRGRL
jgi:glycosyltransferase involved in cell wall biosynthesis